MKVKLSLYGIREAIDKLEYLDDTLIDASQSIVEDLVSLGEGKAKEFDASAPRTGLGSNQIYGVFSKERSSGQVVMHGKNVVYDEFGTGEEGLSDPHPMKGNFPDLNPYNSGPFVSKHINPKNGRHYWYYPPLDGQPYFDFPDEGKGYTEGTPSGKQMYNTLQFIRKEKKQIASKKLKEAIKIFK